MVAKDNLGRTMKRKASKVVRQGDQRAARQGLIEMMEAEGAVPMENFREAVEELAVPPGIPEEDDPLPEG